MKGADRLYSFCSKCFAIFCEQSKTALILEIEIYRFVVLLMLPANFFAALTEVFLKVVTATSSFLEWLLRATFTFDPKWRTEYFISVLYLKVFLNSASAHCKSSTYPRKPFLGSFQSPRERVFP